MIWYTHIASQSSLCNYFPLVAVITFEQLLYNANEYDGVVVCSLILSQPLPTDTVINIVDIEDTAIGEYNL